MSPRFTPGPTNASRWVPRATARGRRRGITSAGAHIITKAQPLTSCTRGSLLTTLRPNIRMDAE
eukprot:5092407-Lingulodinium_polyedra.AAC.1